MASTIMPHFICTTCGTQYAESEQPPVSCTICQDERQYVKATGQNWTTLDKLRLTNRNSLKLKEAGLIGIGIEPHFAIGQRALFLRTPKFNILWDCLPLLDEAVVEAIKALGGFSAIAISHPHYYSCMVEWSRAFGGIPIYLHADDRQWVMRPGKAIVFWEGETKTLGDGLTLIRCGGHFDGGTVLHWAGGADGRGALLSGDIIQVVADRKNVSFMLRPLWHHYSGRVEAHVQVCVLAYALWKTLDHLAKQAKLKSLIKKPDPRYGKAAPKPRPMTPEVILRELGKIKLGDIHLETTDGKQLVLSRVARPDAEQARILAALNLQLPERLSPDRLL